jgi:hypothetical protein
VTGSMHLTCSVCDTLLKKTYPARNSLLGAFRAFDDPHYLGCLERTAPPVELVDLSDSK